MRGLVEAHRVLSGLKQDLLGGRRGAKLEIRVGGGSVGDLLDSIRGDAGSMLVEVVDWGARSTRDKSDGDRLEVGDAVIVIKGDAIWKVVGVSSGGVTLEKFV